ncbi:MAG TPA: acetyl-CoA hydrolase/transferase C-terminal domain-containing protein [Acidimicrobiia bacterium]|nr:acetyl-CoA hydrolase/transferase C-terminal domain-containing protein [Acidimicrobiia bacterium]
MTYDTLTPGAAGPAPRASIDADAVLDHLSPGTNVIVPLAAGEPVTVVDAIERAADRLDRVTVHQMHGLHDRPFLHGCHTGRLEYLSYFLSPVTRAAFHEGACDLVPCHFSEVPALLRRLPGKKLVVAAASPMDRHGYFSLGTNADYVAAFVGQFPFFLEANAQMPRTFGRNQIHVSQTVGWTEADYPLVEVPPAAPNAIDRQIADYVAERIPNEATIQAGIGSIPNAVFEKLMGHRDLGIHTELLSDGLIDLVEAGVVTGTRKIRRPTKVVGTFALGTRRLYDFLHENAAIELLPVDYVNDPRVIGSEPRFVSINATLEVDLLGQAASETLNGRYYSGSGGQSDFARGAMYSDGGQGFIVLHSSTKDESVSRIAAQLPAGSVVTTLKNTVDNVVTEYGVAELRGRPVRERARSLIAIAHPKFRDELTAQARELGYL